MFNSVMFVSLGPGEADLVTVKGLKLLQQADIVFCPSTITSEGKVLSRALNILSELGIDRSKIELFDVPMNKDRTKAIESYNNISGKIIEYFKKGIRIAVTAEGDAGFYSSIHYISDNLSQAAIPTKRIAGIPAFIACGSLANIHIAKQEEELLVIPGITTYNNLKKNIDNGRSVVIMKPSQCEDIIKEMLIGEKDAVFHYFENAGVPSKEFYTTKKEEIRTRKFPYFSLLIIHK